MVKWELVYINSTVRSHIRSALNPTYCQHSAAIKLVSSLHTDIQLYRASRANRHYSQHLISKWRKCLGFSCSCHFLSPARLPASEPQASGVALKVELVPCLIDDWHLCQSIHSAATACNKSHLAGRWADRQGSPESMTSEKHGRLANHQTDRWPRSIRPRTTKWVLTCSPDLRQSHCSKQWRT